MMRESNHGSGGAASGARSRGPRVAALLAAGLLATGATLTGCKSGASREQWKADANNRWNDLRSHVMLEMAQNQFRAGQLEQAEKSVVEALAVDPDHPGLFTLGGRIALERGRLDEAAALFAHATVLAPDYADPYYYQGVVFQRWQRHDDALERYQAAYRLRPDDPTRLTAVAETLITLRRLDEAEVLLKDRLSQYDTNAAIRVLLGHIKAQQGDASAAADYFAAAAVLAPEDLVVQEELARQLVKAGRPDDAARVLRKLIADAELATRLDLRRALADAELACGRTADARQVYIDLTRVDGTYFQDWVKLGELSWKLDDTGGTLIAANRVMDLAPNRSEGYLLAGMVWQKREKLDEALRMFDRAAALNERDATPLLLRGVALQRAEKLAAAEQAFRSAVERDPQNDRARRLLASVQQRRASAAEALSASPVERTAVVD